MISWAVQLFYELWSSTFFPTAAVGQGRFILESGNQCSVVGQRAAGIAMESMSTADVAAGKDYKALVIGEGPLVIGTAWTAGAELTTDAAGAGMPAASGHFVNAIAIEAGTTVGDAARVRRIGGFYKP